MRQREKKREGLSLASRMYRQKEKKKLNQEPLAVARLLFLTSNLQLPSTVYNYSILFLVSSLQRRLRSRGLSVCPKVWVRVPPEDPFIQ